MSKFPLSGGRRGLGRRGEVLVFCASVMLTIVRELEHTRRGGNCAIRNRSATVILPLQAKSKCRRQRLLRLQATALSLLQCCSPEGFGQSHAVAPAVPFCLLFVLTRSSNGLRITSDDVLCRSAGALPVCMVTCMFERKVLKETGSFIKAQIIGPRHL